MTVMNKELQILKIKDFLFKRNIAPDTVDVEALADDTLTLSENLKNIAQLLSISMVDATAEKERAEILAQENELNYLKDTERKALEAIKNESGTNAFLLPELESLADSVRMVVRGHFSGLLCVGVGGFSKSWTVSKVLAEENADFEIINSNITPLSLYSFLHKNNGKVVLIEEAEQVLENAISLGLLRSATDGTLVDENKEKIRMLTYYSTSDKAEGLPQKFRFTGKIILILNSTPNSREFDALCSRLLVHKLELSLPKIKQAILNLSKKGYKDLSVETCQIIADALVNSLRVFHKGISLRLLLKAFEFWRWDKITWFERIEECLEVDEDLFVIDECINSSRLVSEQIVMFKERTGKAQATFFRKKKIYQIIIGKRKEVDKI